MQRRQQTPLQLLALFVAASLFLIQCAPTAQAFSGTEAAAFLDLPVGARPAALGSAYTALASDAYAPTINPGGLGFVDSTQIAAMHVVYLEQTSLEYLSVVHPFATGHALGASIQYFRPGSISGTDVLGNPTGTIQGYYAAYSLAYGQKITEIFSIGATAKLIQAKIDDVTADAWAGDAGLMLQPISEWRVALTGSNMGGAHLKFLSQGDALPVAYRLGTSYKFHYGITTSLEGVHRQSGLNSAGVGFEWTNEEQFSFRAGYDTERIRELSPLAGFTVGLGMNLFGEELAYTWQPTGDLGSAHFISIVLHFGEERRNAINRSGTGDHVNMDSLNSNESSTAQNLLDLK